MAISRNGSNSYSENNKNKIQPSRKITKQLDLLDQKMDGLYRDIYVSRPDNKKNFENIIDKLDSSIDKLQSKDNSVSGMSELLRRIDGNGNNVDNLINSVGELFNDQNLINSLFANQDIHKYLSAENYQYDMMCRYLPKLLDALEIKRDNVLCSDNFSKEFLNPKSSKSTKSELENFAANVKKLENEYGISAFINKTYMNISKYGEEFIYIVPYDLAFKRVLTRHNIKKNSARLGQVSFYESTKSDIVVEANYIGSDNFTSYKKSTNIKIDEYKDFKGSEVKLHFNETNVVNSSINERVILESLEEADRFKSLFSLHEESLVTESDVSGSLSKQMEEVKNNNDKITSASTNDGLIIPSNLDRDANKIDKNMLGAVVERIPRENIVPIYIGKKCMGYYYFEFLEDKNSCGFCGTTNHAVPGVSNSARMNNQLNQDQQEMAVRYIAKRMSDQIDTHFINKNKDLKEEIYSVLRYNEKFDISRSNDIGVTFIPAEDIVHCYFEKDEVTHRGISDLQKATVPAMLYILLYLTDIIGKISRSTDKRIYYVKQNVETNVARTMMNVVQQIKKGNMGMRQIESMNNILNIVGKYNDYIIPLGQSGDPPIQFEVMQGQDIQTPTDIMEKMEEAAVNSTGVPIELVNSTLQQDFAIRFSMSNTRFLKSVNTRQSIVQKFLSKIYTKIYNYEFGENNSCIEIILPPPVYLTMQNNQQLFDNITQQADKIIELELSDKSDEVKAEFKKIYTRNNLASYINFDQIERYKMMAETNVECNKIPSVEEDPGDDDMMDY